MIAVQAASRAVEDFLEALKFVPRALEAVSFERCYETALASFASNRLMEAPTLSWFEVPDSTSLRVEARVG